jgi:hypothetical protein
VLPVVARLQIYICDLRHICRKSLFGLNAHTYNLFTSMDIDAITLTLGMTLGWLLCGSVDPGRGNLQESRNED